MKKKIKKLRFDSSVKSVDLKEKVFQGKILLIENFDEIESLNRTIKKFFYRIFWFYCRKVCQ